ncbi:MAG: sulfotransferase, partial [Pseudomonadota bacterium]|nr:sulfotransferase [Pseudomonadota bacterium]
QANRLLARLWKPRRTESDAFVTHTDKLAGMFTEKSVANWRNQKVAKPENNPVFLVGFPRSGTTLLDQVLDSHPGLCTLEEKPMVQAMDALLDKYPGGYYENLATLTPSQAAVLRARYFEVVRDYISPQDGQIVIDKFPFNITQTGLLWRVFPEAKYILAIRHPCDVCISCFRQNFALNAAMSHFLSLEDTVALYVKVMQTWQHYVQILPVVYHQVRYEDLVDDLEREAKSVIKFLGLDWDPVVMDYITHARSRERINTPSYTQVIKPIYTHAKYRWRRYSEQINPYIEQLQPFITSFSYHEV